MSLLRGRSFSLRTRLVALAALLLFGVSLFLVLYFPARMERLARTWLERRAVAVATLLANAAAPGLEFDDGAQVSELLAGLAATPEALYADLHTEKGERLATWERPGAAQPPAHLQGKGVPERAVLSEEGGVLHLRQPVVTRAGGKGVLTLGLSLAELAQEQEENLFAVGSVSLGMFVVSLGLFFVIGTVLVRPIRRVSEVTALIAEGDLAGAEAQLGGAEQVRRMAEAQEGAAARADEGEQLAASCARMLQALRGTSATLLDSSRILTGSVENLTGLAGSHRQTIARQAAALQETQVTVEEIKQTSVLAAQKAEAVMQVAARAEQVSVAGEAAITRSLEGLSAIRTRVEEVSTRVAELGERTRQIGSITQTVKDLADQSNMLALNAAIEAVRSGEHGKGFGVVAREIRTLADQSIQSTDRVREILDDISAAVQAAVAISAEGSRHVEAGLEQVRGSGDNLRELSAIVKDNASAVRQISAAVSQQSVGFAQVFTAVTSLSAMMDETVRGIDETQSAVDGLQQVSSGIRDAAGRYRL
jgi:methyl-accepting chemotaxis protein